MKKLLLAASAVFIHFSSNAQCLIKEVPLAQRVANSDLIIEGKVTEKHSFWNAAHNMIYTANTVEIYKIFKGSVSASSIEVITEGGTVDYYMIKANPSLSLNVGEIGTFTCENPKRYDVTNINRSGLPQYEAYASVQGFIKYDLQNGTASDAFKKYTNIENQLYPAVLSPSMPVYSVVKPFDISTGNDNSERVILSISGFSPTTLTAGTGAVLTINGTGFGATQGSTVVRFKNADDGGATFITPLASQYISWSSSQITVEVPQNAGSGTIQVFDGSNTATSSGSLTISYAHLNVDFDPGPGTTAYETDHVDENGSGGYTWRMNTGFDASTSARASFMRAFDSWRCTTGINWTIGATTSINDAVSDGTNIICFDNAAPLSPGILGVCYSYWSGCANGPTIIWYVNELDIIFDEGSNISPLTWQYGPAAPSGSQYDFESVAVHELGHGHQLGHVISPGAIMHYALANGSSNHTPGTNDLAGANFVQAKSIVANVCGPGAMTNYTCGSPVATTQVASNQCGKTVTDLSGNFGCVTVAGAQNYEWEFTNSGLSYSSTTKTGTGTSTIAKTSIAGLRYGTSYNVRVRAKVGGIWGNFGNTCVITIAPSSTKMAASQCGQIITDLSGAFSCNPIVGAEDYQWEFANPGLSYLVTKTRGSGINSITKTLITGLKFGVSYNVRVKVKVGGAWGSYGTVCVITMGPIPSTQVAASQCGQIIDDLSGVFYCDAIAGAEDYQWEFANSGLSYLVTKTRGSNTNSITKTSFTGLKFGVAYNVRVRAKVSGAWGSYGPVCVLTMGPFPSTQVAASQCGQALTDLSGVFYCDAIAGAEDYQWEISNTGLSYLVTKTRGTGINSITKTLFTGLQAGVSYTVRVKAKVSGVWGSYGTVCSIVLNSLNTIALDNLSERSQESIIENNLANNSDIKMVAYPNPSGNAGFNVDLENIQSATDVIIEVYDMLGNKVWYASLPGKENGPIAKINADGNFTAGTYLVHILVNGHSLQQRVIVQ